MNVLVTIPDLNLSGGVSEIYKVLSLNSIENVDYFIVLSKQKKFRMLQLILLFYKFFFKCRSYSIIHINPSLNFSSVLRESILIILSKLRNKKVVVQFHGWNDDFQNKIQQTWLLRKYFQTVYSKVDAFILLGQVFKTKLIQLKIKQNIPCYFLPTIADNSYINEDLINYRKQKISNIKSWQILFLSRLTNKKGLDIAIDCQKILENLHPNKYKLVVAGDGELKSWAEVYASKSGVQEIIFCGFVKDEIKHKLFLNSDIFLLPTSYGEGLPCTIMEAMLYGLPILSRNVGGIPDWVQNNENGIISDSLNAITYADYIIKLTNNTELMIDITMNNIKKAISNFTNEKIKNKLFFIYNDVTAKSINSV